MWNLFDLVATSSSSSIAGIEPKSKIAFSTLSIVFCLFCCSTTSSCWKAYSSYSLLKKNVEAIIIKRSAAYLKNWGTFELLDFTFKSLYLFKVELL
jgi:hypothetical protein